MMNDILTKYAAVPPPPSSSSFRRRRRSARTRWDKWEREASERAESWRDEFLIPGFTVGRRRRKKKRKRQLHLEALQGCFSISRRAVLPTIVTSASFFFLFLFLFLNQLWNAVIYSWAARALLVRLYDKFSLRTGGEKKNAFGVVLKGDICSKHPVCRLAADKLLKTQPAAARPRAPSHTAAHASWK